MNSKTTEFFRRIFAITPMRYIFIGGVLFLIDLSVFMGLKHFFGIASPIAQAFSRTTGAAAGFAAHKLFTFRNREFTASSIAIQGSGYMANTVFTILFSPIVLVLIENLISNNLVVVKLLTEIVMVCETFVVQRYIFKNRKLKARPESRTKN